MKTYLVGGAVRDKLLGRPVADRDWVVVGADAEAMTAAGFRPVGKDFPVFLHPETHEEYALARTERKTGKGYRGFAFYAAADVTLEEDLQRRDLTINAMAEDAEGNLVDPYGGAGDLRRGVLRHVGPAFAEDPVRILRTARFAARYGFVVAPETMALMREMVTVGEADALVPERVWQELAKGLMEPRPDLLLKVLNDSDALKVLLPETAKVCVGKVGKLLHVAAQDNFTLEERFALWMLQVFGSGNDAASRAADAAAKLRVPKSCSDTAVLAVRFAGSMSESNKLSADAVLAVFQAADIFRRPQRFDSLLRVVGASSVKTPEETGTWKTGWQRLRSAVMQPDAAKIARAAEPPSAAAEAIRRARLDALQAVLPPSANRKKEISR